MSDEMNAFRSRREELGLSQSDIAYRMRQEAEKLGRDVPCTVGAVSGWDRGQVPSGEYADVLALVYGRPEETIWQWIREMTEAKRAPATAKAG